MWIERASQVQGNLERMAVQATALVPFRHVGQAVGRFERKLFKDFHDVLTQ
ncbi:hypothetical protein D3C76_1406970 [compost metagenome]